MMGARYGKDEMEYKMMLTSNIHHLTPEKRSFMYDGIIIMYYTLLLLEKMYKKQHLEKHALYRTTSKQLQE